MSTAGHSLLLFESAKIRKDEFFFQGNRIKITTN